jgi:hypothetical protein
MTAGTVDQMIDDRNGPVPADPTATLVGLGVRSGWSVTLPNRGGQYQNSFVDPYLDVQVVGPTRAQVHKTMARLINRIMAALTALQDAEHVAPADRITAKVLPEPVPPVYFEHGSRIRALGASAAILITVAALAAAALSRLARRRPRSRTIGTARRGAMGKRPRPETAPNEPRPLAMRG